MNTFNIGDIVKHTDGTESQLGIVIDASKPSGFPLVNRDQWQIVAVSWFGQSFILHREFQLTKVVFKKLSLSKTSTNNNCHSFVKSRSYDWHK